MHRLPEIVKDVAFDFPFDFEHDSKKIWALNLPVTVIPTALLQWHLDIPFWSSDNGFYDLSPRSLLKSPQLSPLHYERVRLANLTYPVDYTFYKGRFKIVDGLHRYTKIYSQDRKELEVRFISQELLLATI